MQKLKQTLLVDWKVVGLVENSGKLFQKNKANEPQCQQTIMLKKTIPVAARITGVSSILTGFESTF